MRTFSSGGHHPARDGCALLVHGPHGQALSRCSSSSSSIFDDELDGMCADPFPLLAWHHMTMPSLSRNLRSTLARSPTRDRLPTLHDQILRLPGRLQVWLDAMYGYSLSWTR